MKLIEATFREFADNDAVQDFLRIIDNYNYCIIGGLAVSLYSKSARKVSPDDLDVYIDETQIDLFLKDLISQGFHIVRNHNFQGTQWYVVARGKNQEFDIALKSKGSNYFDRPEIFSYRGLKLKVISKPLLINNKLLAARDKDLRDLLYLLKDESFSSIQSLRKKLRGAKLELFDQMVDDLDNFEMMIKVYGS